MEDKNIILLAVVLLASGCAQDSGTTASSGEGLQLQKFSVEDTTLSPEQKTRAEAVFVNYNKGDTSLKSSNVKLFNLGQMKNISRECTPSELGDAKDGINPKMRCVWTLQAPGEDFIQGFESKPMSVNLRYQYTSSIDSENPLKVQFKDSVTDRSEKSTQFSDNVVQVSMSTESPVSTNSQQDIELVAENMGSGDLKGSYNFEYTPLTTFDSCPESKEPIDGEARVDCYLESGSTGDRNLFVSTSYKYEQIRNTYIEVVQ